ncbi:MAG: peptidoglycan DD-metalloendopeptidase family protein [Chloroflexota bacterium]|jgi:murein DD-endopeptidase MepM/ murein hydrolase activator NlpD
MTNLILTIALLVIVFLPAGSVNAQTSSELPVYLVQPGDNLNTIALRFGVAAQDIIDANQIANPNILSIGTALKIPGFEGVTGTLKFEVAPLGATLSGISRQYRVTPETVVRLNQLTSPAQIYIGSTLILPDNPDAPQLKPVSIFSDAESHLEKAVKLSANPWELAFANKKTNTWDYLPGEVIYAADIPPLPGLFGSPLVENIEILPLPLRQGKTHVVKVTTTEPLILSGTLNDVSMAFFQTGDNEYVAIQGVHAMAQPGLTTFKIEGALPDRKAFAFEQAILLEPINYPKDVPLMVDPQTIDPAITKPEDDLVHSITEPATPVRHWSGVFKVPVDEPCIRSWFGSRRSYNNSPFIFFHSGVDYGVCANNLNIYAPAPGIVVFVGDLTVRGLSTIIDHGWGIYSGMWHQTSVNVQVGDMVETGQLIGEIGNTGRVTGPHLHWEVWANKVQVEPLDWLDISFP